MEGTREEHPGDSSVCDSRVSLEHTFRCVRLISPSLFVILLIAAPRLHTDRRSSIEHPPCPLPREADCISYHFTTFLMVEYVYARHEFAPEHEDEIAFRAGERIEVIEKDEVYNDGWWQVCVALFAYFVPIQYSLLPRVSPFYISSSSWLS